LECKNENYFVFACNLRHCLSLANSRLARQT